MSVKAEVCRRCKRLFQSYGNTICPICTEEMDREYLLVKEYIYDHPDANLSLISAETGVTQKTVLYFLREGRLSIKDSEDMLKCIECDTPIKSGKYCAACACRLENALRRVFQDEQGDQKTSDAGRMHSDFNKRTF